MKYKKRKEEALRKLDKTNDALDRVEDIIKELEVQVEPLKEQSEKAKEYKTLKEELENLEIALIAYDIYNLSTNEEILKKEKDELDKEIIDLDNYVEIERNPFNIKDVLKDKGIVSNLYKPTSDVVASYHLNVFNSYTAYYLYKLGYKAVTLSVELNNIELKDLIESIRKRFGNIPIIIKTKGYVEVMLIKGNILNIDKDTSYTLVNVKNDKFKVYFDGRCTYINSSYNLDLDEKELEFDNVYFTGEKL